jgi:hypothetical protein
MGFAGGRGMSTLSKVAGSKAPRGEVAVKVVIYVFVAFWIWEIVAGWTGKSVETQLQRIHAMPGATPLEYHWSDRSRTAAQKYGTSSDAATVRRYYSRQMLSDKWVYSSTKHSGDGVIDTYCRDGFSGRVEINAFSMNDYETSRIRWGDRWPTLFEVRISKGKDVFPKPDWDCITFGGFPYHPRQ